MTDPNPTQAVSIRMPTRMVERIDASCAETGMSRTAAILLAVHRGLRHLPGAQPDLKPAPEYRDWINGMSYADIAEKYGHPDIESAWKAVRATRESFVSDLNDSGHIVIRVDPDRLAGTDD